MGLQTEVVERLVFRPFVGVGCVWLAGIGWGLGHGPGPWTGMLAGGGVGLRIGAAVAGLVSLAVAAQLVVAAGRRVRAFEAPDTPATGPAAVSWPRLLLPLVGAFVLGALRAQADSVALDPPHVAGYVGGPVAVAGVIVDEPWVDDRGPRYRVAVDRARALNRSPAGRSGAGGRERSDRGRPDTFEAWRPAHGLVLVRGPVHPVLAYGDGVVITGTLESPPEFDGFDYPAYLARKDVYAVVRRPKLAATGRSQANPVRAGLLAIKDRGRRGLAAGLPEPESSLATGILLGDARRIPESVAEAFQVTNTTHVIAISGSNIALVVAFLSALIGRWLAPGRSVLPILAGIAAYTALVGGDAAVVRAALMGGVGVLAILARRQADAATALMAAAVLMTAYRPGAIHDLGFQLSFAATAGLIVYSAPAAAWVTERLTHQLGEGRGQALVAALNEAVLVTVAAQVTTWPLIAYHIGQVSVAGFVANALIVPVQGPVMALAALTAAAGAVWEPLAVVFGYLAWIPLAYTIRVVEQVATWPLASVAVPVGLGGLAAYYLLLAAATTAVAGRARGGAEEPGLEDEETDRATTHLPDGAGLERHAPAKPPSATRKRAGSARRQTRLLAHPVSIAGLAVLAGVAWLAASGRPDGLLHVRLLDVGQGDAILVQAPAGQRLLVDGGPEASRVLDGLGRLWPPWDRRLDLVLLTHPDADHVGGLAGVAQRYRIGQALEPGIPGGPEAMAWRQAMADRGTPVRLAVAGGWIDLDPKHGVVAEVLWPPPRFVGAGPNDHSVVLRLRYGDVAFLLTGDIEAPAEARLTAEAGERLTAQVLKVAHHGSATSTTKGFLAAVSPTVVLISAGLDNAHGHPAEEVLERVADRHVWRTDLDGAVDVMTDGRRLWVRTEGR